MVGFSLVDRCSNANPLIKNGLERRQAFFAGLSINVKYSDVRKKYLYMMFLKHIFKDKKSTIQRRYMGIGV